jgi:hypothetical protein
MAKYFKPSEFACPCCGLQKMDPALVQILDEVRGETGLVMVINSGTRCIKHNTDVGGARLSAHLVNGEYSHAADIACTNDLDRGRLAEACYKRGIRRFEASNKHLHVDNATYLPSPMLKAVVFR